MNKYRTKDTEKTVTVYLTAKEYETVKKDAADKHMTLTGYIRFLIINNAGKSIGQILGVK